jgi:large subunit ribosomal protein L35
MQKTKKSIAKRFKMSATGKILRRTPGRRHLLSNKSSRQLGSSGGDKLVSEGFSKQVKRATPFI